MLTLIVVSCSFSIQCFFVSAGLAEDGYYYYDYDYFLAETCLRMHNIHVNQQMRN
jgi:hypothetical protein